MFKKILILTLLFSSISVSARLVLVAVTNSQTRQGAHRVASALTFSDVILVPDNHIKIQWAINNASNGDTIYVKAGIYFENLVANKSISLIGEGRDKTIVDGQGKGTLIYVTDSNVLISNFTLQNGSTGIWLSCADNSTVQRNNVKNNAYGIKIDNSKNSFFAENIVEDNEWFGMVFSKSGNSTLRNNRFVGTRYNLRVDGSSLCDFINDIDTSNTVNDMPIYYLKNQRDLTIDSSVFPKIGYLAFVNSTNINVRNLNLVYNGQGILFAYTRNSIINKVSAISNWNGIEVQHSSNVTASENNANNNFDYGIKFFNSSHSLVSGNNVDNNGWAGIGLFRSASSTVDGNEANFNTYNLHIVYTNSSLITRNNAPQSKPDGYSIAVYYSHCNDIYHNTFTNSLLYNETRNGTPFTPRNNWDNGLEGNYWSFYRGIDADQDGIGDTSCMVGENNVDNHPLMGKFSNFMVTLGEKTYNVTVISNSTISQFQFSPSEKKISFMAAVKNGTIGFSRIAILNTLLQDLHDGNLIFLINGKQPFLKKNWTDGTDTYFYFFYVNAVSEPAISTWFIAAVASVPLVIFLLVFVVFKKKWGSFSKQNSKRTEGKP